MNGGWHVLFRTKDGKLVLMNKTPMLHKPSLEDIELWLRWHDYVSFEYLHNVPV